MLSGNIDKAKFHEYQKSIKEMLDKLQERLDFKYDVTEFKHKNFYLKT